MTFYSPPAGGNGDSPYGTYCDPNFILRDGTFVNLKNLPTRGKIIQGLLILPDGRIANVKNLSPTERDRLLGRPVDREVRASMEPPAREVQVPRRTVHKVDRQAKRKLCGNCTVL